MEGLKHEEKGSVKSGKGGNNHEESLGHDKAQYCFCMTEYFSFHKDKLSSMVLV